MRLRPASDASLPTAASPRAPPSTTHAAGRFLPPSTTIHALGAVSRLPSTRSSRPHHSRLGIETDAAGVDRRRRTPAFRADVDEAIARTAGALRAADDRAGSRREIGATDASIAAIADVLDDAVLTDTVDEFEALGVPVEPYCAVADPTRFLTGAPGVCHLHPREPRSEAVKGEPRVS